MHTCITRVSDLLPSRVLPSKVRKYFRTFVLSYHTSKYESTFEGIYELSTVARLHVARLASYESTKVPSKVLSYFVASY